MTGPDADTDDRPTLHVPSEIRDAVLERARDGRPREICGVFGGAFGPDRSHVRSQYPAENVAENPHTRYLIDPEEQLAVFERFEDRGEEVVGFYHSHPRGPPRPSETDVAAATWPDRSYLIVSLEPETIGSWRWRSSERSTDGSCGSSAVDSEESGKSGGFERERLVVE
ncbi:desampylase [Halopiger goleimassiliensis]|uniref:desampylase n=1 Tax=Halopiger goleimassiliensis TaxID=1293048 RepID=UPI0006777A7F|nr:desampylase [Halopiger goleimassiliensis]